MTQGKWFGTSGKAQVSIEEGIAKTIRVKMGDVLRFNVAGLPVEAPVTSVRKVDWNSFKVNFFVLMPPDALADLPATFITSFHLPSDRDRTIDGLVAQYPNITAIDTTPILAQIQRTLAQVIGAVQFLFLFTLAAGVLVLYAALGPARATSACANPRCCARWARRTNRCARCRSQSLSRSARCLA